MQVPAKYFQTPAKIMELIQKVVEYIPQIFENIAGVVGKNPQFLQYSLFNPPQSWWTHYNFIFFSFLLIKYLIINIKIKI